MFVAKPTSMNMAQKFSTGKIKLSNDIDYAKISSSITKLKSGDTLTVSSQMREFLASIDKGEKEKIEAQISDAENLIAENKAMLEQMKEQSKQKNDTFSDLTKCLIIAMRIINGDIVPRKDDKFLAETEPEMYFKAKLLRRQNDDPRDYKALTEDEKEKSKTDFSGSENTDSPTVQIKSIPNDGIVFQE